MLVIITYPVSFLSVHPKLFPVVVLAVHQVDIDSHPCSLILELYCPLHIVNETLFYKITDIVTLKSECADEKADLEQNCLQMSKIPLSHDMSQVDIDSVDWDWYCYDILILMSFCILQQRLAEMEKSKVDLEALKNQMEGTVQYSVEARNELLDTWP